MAVSAHPPGPVFARTSPVAPLGPEALYRRCDPSTLRFASTDELPEQNESLGQERALAALRFGTGIRREGFNLFALGPAGVGKHQLVQRFLHADFKFNPDMVAL